MGIFFRYLKLQGKRAVGYLPSLLLTSLILAVVVAVIAVGSSRLLYQDQVSGRVEVAIVTEEEDSLGKSVLSMLGSMGSVESLCDFIETDEEEAREGLSEGRYAAAILVPPDMVESIINGTNRPVTILLAESGGIETLLLEELAESGAEILGSAQAGIYAADCYASERGFPELIPELEEALNKVYLGYALSRDGWYERITVSALGQMDLSAYYGTTAAALFLFLLGLPCARLAGRETGAFRVKLQGASLRAPGRVLAKLLAVAGAICLAMLAVIFVLRAGLRFLPSGNVPEALSGFMGWEGPWSFGAAAKVLAGCGLASLTCGSTIVFAYTATDGKLTGSMLLFVMTAVMIFLAGGLLPSAFLPEAVRPLAAWMPAGAVRQLLGGLWGFPADALAYGKGFGFTLLFYLLAVAADTGWKEVRN